METDFEIFPERLNVWNESRAIFVHIVHFQDPLDYDFKILKSV